MSKKKNAEKVFVGIDVSKDRLDVCVGSGSGAETLLEFSNDAQGHGKLVRRLKKARAAVRIALESTGTYSFDVSVALCEAGFEVTVANPRAVHHFAQASMLRTHTDRTAAQCLREFAQRMDCEPWTPPSPQALQLRQIARRVQALTTVAASEKNRLHALEISVSHSSVVAEDIRANIEHLEDRSKRLVAEAREIIEADPVLAENFRFLCSITGFHTLSAVKLLGELVAIPKDLTAKQMVAMAGLNPRHKISGTSVHKPARISKQGNARLRAILYMPALVAKRSDPHVRAFAEKLEARGKAKLQVIVAIMRKLLHSIHGMFNSRSHFVGEKFFVIQEAA
jgi:transposase